MDEATQNSDTVTVKSRSNHTNLMDFPAELQLEIASYLTYPDALALKHTCSYFYALVYTGVHLKVDWFVERFEHKLECPMEKCSFRTDEAFCNARIQHIMERRRWHLECRRIPGGCWVIEGNTCQRDLVPSWLKMQGSRKSVKMLIAWGRESNLLLSLLYNYCLLTFFSLYSFDSGHYCAVFTIDVDVCTEV
ncbi:hypothetical protein N7495_002340 [Penicillium taxi]|uniref:uncharacterized protein n=1 Tax=Penicillium taxi TaxID=168475 RepID=UPI002545A8FB|nr:uncharacterized protein N7495_002340 [Penicillium taxi]KAJ5901812.1 hypothetical protein N7495_002340 [Penicillium taxi]